MHVAKRRIAAARNGGARAASGEILCFIDADSAIHPNTFNEIARVMNTQRYVWGVTGAVPERNSVGPFITHYMFMPMVWLTGLDIGLSFCRREDWQAVGGYDETRLYAEDVLFPWALRRLGRTRGQRLTRIPKAKALHSARKFDQFGEWHYFLMLRTCVQEPHHLELERRETRRALLVQTGTVNRNRREGGCWLFNCMYAPSLGRLSRFLLSGSRIRSQNA